MTTHPRDVVAVAHQTLALNETALKQVAVLFNRIAFPGLATFLSFPTPYDSKLKDTVAWLAETGILFEPDITPSNDQDFKDRLLHDIDELYKPVGLKAEELIAARKDKEKFAEIRDKVRDPGAYSSTLADLPAVFEAIQRMTVNMTRLAAIQLRQFANLDAHAIVPIEFSSLEQKDEHPNKQDVLKIVVNALPVPDPDVSWQQVIEYRNDLNSLNRFIDLRNWISDVACLKLSAFEVEQSLRPVLKRFHKQMEIHRMKTVTTTFEAFVNTSSDVLRNLFSHGGTATKMGICSVEHRKVALLEGESPSEVREVAFVWETTSLFDTSPQSP